MKPNRAIVINGFAYGGSNLLWNVLQSHPSLVSVMRETGLFFYPKSLRKFQPLLRKWYNLFPYSATAKIHLLEARKIKNLESLDHREKMPGVPYKADELQQAIPVFKSLNKDVYLNPHFERSFDRVDYIAIVRNGYALCESWKRRGRTTAEAIDHYLRIGRYFMEQEQKDPRFKVVRMEDILIDPFAVSLELNKFLGQIL